MRQGMQTLALGMKGQKQWHRERVLLRRGRPRWRRKLLNAQTSRGIALAYQAAGCKKHRD